MGKKKHRTAYQKSTANIEIEGRKQLFLIYGATGIALYRHYNMRKTAIVRLFEITSSIWEECAADINKSMIKMCYEETGIEIQCGNGKSWEDLPYLNGKINKMRLTDAQWVYIRHQQVKWIAPQVMACILLALHRKKGFGFDRCAKFYQRVQEIEAEFENDPDMMRAECKTITGVDVADTVTKRRESA